MAAPAEIQKLVERFEMHRDNSMLRLTTDRRVDRLVYELNGLTDEGIRIVEEATDR